MYRNDKMMINSKNIDKEIKLKEEAIDRLKNEKEALAKGIEITWKNDSVTNEKADSISFDRRKVNIEYKDETTVIPLKNIKKLKFANSLLKLTYDWNWGFKTHEDSTSDGSISTPIRVWYKYTSRTDTSGVPISYSI